PVWYTGRFQLGSAASCCPHKKDQQRQEMPPGLRPLRHSLSPDPFADRTPLRSPPQVPQRSNCRQRIALRPPRRSDSDRQRKDARRPDNRRRRTARTSASPSGLCFSVEESSTLAPDLCTPTTPLPSCSPPPA